jgi:hypothetical protein
VIGAPRFERREPPAETGKLIRRQLSNSFGDFLDLHVIKYSTAECRMESLHGRFMTLSAASAFGNAIVGA